MISIVGNVHPFELNSEMDCAALALRFSRTLNLDHFKHRSLQIWFVADLGSGKTTLIRYLLHALGFLGKVKSPTYQLCESYTIQIYGEEVSVHHFDLYRMNHELEWEEAGFKEIMTEPGIVLIEWPEKANNTLPQPDLIFKMQYQSEHVRSGTIEAYSEFGKKILHSFN